MSGSLLFKDPFHPSPPTTKKWDPGIIKSSTNVYQAHMQNHHRPHDHEYAAMCTMGRLIGKRCNLQYC